MQPYDPNSIVDVLKSSGQPSDIQSRAQLAMKYQLASSPEDYYSKAATGGVNTALISKLKGTGGQTGSMSTTGAPVNASTPIPGVKTGVTTPPATTPPVTPPAPVLGQTTPTTPPTPASGQSMTGLESLGVTRPTVKTEAELRAEAQAVAGAIEPTTGASGNPEINGRQVYKSVGGNWIYNDTGEVAGQTKESTPAYQRAEAQKKQNELYQNQELEQSELSIKHNRDILYNSLAARGLLEPGATAGDEEIKKFNDESDVIRTKIRDKWAVANSGVSAQLAADIQGRIDKELERLRTDQKERIDNSFKQTQLLQEARQKEIENQFKEKELEVNKAYNEGRLSLEEKNLALSRLKANAEIKKLEAETTKIKAETAGTGTGTGANAGYRQKSMQNINTYIDTALGQVGGMTTGITGAVASKIPGTQAADLRSTLTTIKANIGFEALQAMREASKTGGALGQVAVQELEALQSTLGSLDTRQSPEQLTTNLIKIRNHYRNAMGAIEQANGGVSSGGVEDTEISQLKAMGYTDEQIRQIQSQ